MQVKFALVYVYLPYNIVSKIIYKRYNIIDPQKGNVTFSWDITGSKHGYWSHLDKSLRKPVQIWKPYCEIWESMVKLYKPKCIFLKAKQYLD